MVFNTEWFTKHQKKLLLLTNTWIGRRIFCIYGKRSRVGRNKITKITPNAIFWKDRKGGENRVEFRTHPKFAKRIYHAFKPIWYIIHAWDMLFANRFIPAWNLGFDELGPVYSGAGDGQAQHDNQTAVWNTCHDATAGSAANSSSGSSTRFAGSYKLSNNNFAIYRFFFPADTSALGLTTTVTAATLDIYVFPGDGLISPDAVVVSTTQASTSEVVTDDYNQIGGDAHSDTITASDTGYKTWTLDESGREAISKDGTTQLGIRNKTYDFDDSAPADNGIWCSCYLSEQTGTSNDPFYSITFTTIPTAQTDSATNIDTVTATGNGDITSDGGESITERGIVLSTSVNPTTADTKFTTSGTTGAFSVSLTSLSPNTLYHVRAYAINANGTAYGADKEFTTLPLPEVLIINNTQVERITKTSAVLTANFVSDGDKTVTEKGAVLGTSRGPVVGTDTKFVHEDISTGEFEVKLTGLSADTFYFVRAYVTTEEDGTIYA